MGPSPQKKKVPPMKEKMSPAKAGAKKIDKSVAFLWTWTPFDVSTAKSLDADVVKAITKFNEGNLNSKKGQSIWADRLEAVNLFQAVLKT